MYELYLKTESEFFCLLIVAFLYIFQSKISQPRSKNSRLMYFFTAVQLVLSAVCGIVQNNVCFALCTVCFFLAAYFCIMHIFDIAERKLSAACKALAGLACAIAAFGVYYSLTFGINIGGFTLVCAIVAAYAFQQYNRIRIDNLTRLYNRYGMDAELKEQLRQYERENTDSFYLIVCDLDNFKHINDTWGHPEGDRALVLIAKALAKVGKQFDSGVFRIGGDEFVIITDKSEEGLADKVTAAVKKELDGIDFRSDFDIEMSIGVALYDGVTPIDELINNADKKMYEAKRNEKAKNSDN